MAAGQSRKITAASARSHTRSRHKPNSSSPSPFNLPSGIFMKILLVFFVGFVGWAYQAISPPMTKTCGSPGGPAVTAPRIQLTDGRYMAYEELGVPKESAKSKIIFIHGFDDFRHNTFVAQLSKDVLEDLSAYVVSIDRPGYGESDPDPNRTVKSLALDIEELADKLGLGSKFYVVGFSLGGQVTWSCLKHIPHRLAGAALLAPVVNLWWPSLPSNLSKEGLAIHPPSDQWSLRIAHYVPWLTYWWNTQTWFPSLSIIAHNPSMFSKQDLEILAKLPRREDLEAQTRQQGEYESIHRDLMIGFGRWDFDPTDLKNPFPNNEGSVHLWQGDEDRMVPIVIQRYIVQQLPWIQYHEIPGAGHMFPVADGMANSIIKSLLSEASE